MDRTVARACAMKLVYEWEMGGDGGEDTRLGLLEIKPDECEVKYMNALVQGVTENVEKLDEKISQFAIGWTIERITRVDLAILRIAVYELMFGDVASAIVINEAVELANVYSTDKAGAFINGVLGSVSRSLKK